MNQTPARMGWDWVKQAFGMLRKQPAGLTALFFGYMLVSMLLNIIPLLGAIAHSVLTPVFVIGFITAARDVEAGRMVLPRTLIAGFKEPAFGKLCKLGGLHVLAILAAVTVMMLFADTAVLKGKSPEDLQPSLALMQEVIRFPGLQIGFVLYVVMLLVITFAAPIVCWNTMGPGKGLFYSFFAIKRTAGAFFVLMLSLGAIAFGSMMVLRLLFGAGAVGQALMGMVSVLLYGIGHIALYFPYTHIFGPLPDNKTVPPAP
jgi:hypothetical protein